MPLAILSPCPSAYAFAMLSEAIPSPQASPQAKQASIVLPGSMITPSLLYSLSAFWIS